MRKMYSFAVLLAMMLVSTTAKAQFTGSTDQGFYDGTTQITFDLAPVAEAFGVSSETLIADLETFQAATKAANATEADALGMKVQLIVNGGETVYPTDEIGYTAGYNGTYWMTKEGAAIAWGTEGFAWYAEWFVDQENVLFGFNIGKNADVWAEGGSATANLAWTYNEKTVNFELTLNVEAKPAVEPVETNWDNLTFVEGVTVNVTQNKSAGWSSDQIKVAVPTLLSSLGFTADNLASLNDVLYAREYVDEYDSESDIHHYSYTGKITNEFTAGAPGFWFGPTYTWDEATEDNIADRTYLVRFAYGDTDLFFAEQFSFVPAATDADVDSLVFLVGQMPNAASDAGEEYHATVYLMHGATAFPVEIVLTITETDHTGDPNLATYTLAYETNIKVEKTLTGAHTNYSNKLEDIDAIVEALGADNGTGLQLWVRTTAGGDELKRVNDGSPGPATSFLDEGIMWVNAEGVQCSWGDTPNCAVMVSYYQLTDGTYNIGTMERPGGGLPEDGEISFPVFLVNTITGKYCQVNITWNTHDQHADEKKTMDQWERVAFFNVNAQILTGAAMTNTYDLPWQEILEAVGVTSGDDVVLYGQITTDDPAQAYVDGETLTFTKQYTCTPHPGFWMDAEGKYPANWAATDAYGWTLSYATGQIQWYSYSATARTAGDSYSSVFYLVDEYSGKYVQLNFNLRFVDEIVETEVVGEKTVFLTWESVDKNDGYNYNYVDINDMVDALLEGDASLLQSCTWLVYKNGDYASSGDIYPEFNYYDTDGKYVGNEQDTPALYDTASFSVGYNTDEEAFSVSSLGKEEWDGEAKLVELAVEYEGKRYLLHVYAGTAEQIAEIETGIDSIAADKNAKKQVFDLAGRRVSAPAKGLYIVNGKKVLVK